MNKLVTSTVVVLVIVIAGIGLWLQDERNMETVTSLWSCVNLVSDGLRDVADDRADRFLGKVQEDTARCRGGDKSVELQRLDRPWVDWGTYWGAGDASSRNTRYDSDNWFRRAERWLFSKLHVEPNLRGIDGALIDLEYERVELIKFNLFDNYTYETYVTGAGGDDGPVVSKWSEMRLPPEHPEYAAVGGDGPQQCNGELVRHRTLTGICNDIENPLMGSSNTLFARNVQFEETFPDEQKTDLTRARHGGRIDVMTPDPQLVSRKLFTREQEKPELCNEGQGLNGYAPDANCDYQPAPFFNVLAAFWIQFMTHDWFSHLREGENDRSRPMMSAGCTDEAAQTSGCRQGDQIEPPFVAQDGAASTFTHKGKQHQNRAHKTFRNTVTAWWDASQIYGFDEVSQSRVKRDPNDPARLLMRPIGSDDRAGGAQGYLPRFASACAQGQAAGCDNIHASWSNQETAGFADNWTIGMSFYHNVFSREHNAFVDAFREVAQARPGDDSGLRDPARPGVRINYADVTDDELFEAARLVVSAEIAKIHTIEWTTQLLYNDPLHRGMNSNWDGLFQESKLLNSVADRLVIERLAQSDDFRKRNHWYSVLAAGPGIFGLGSKRYEDKTIFQRFYDRSDRDVWSLLNSDNSLNVEHVNGGINHFGSPFNFPEEFVTVYRLHPLVPDLLELRDIGAPNQIEMKVPAVHGFRAGASDIVQAHGLADWALSMGRQRLGLLTLGNHAQFLQNLTLPRLRSATNKVDIAALDLIRDRQRGIPRFNEFRRQYGLKQLTSFDDFIDVTLPEHSPARLRQEKFVKRMREVYGQHRCDATLIISHAQRIDGEYPNDCLGHPDGTMVDNIEDLDTVVGWLAEPVRPHGYAISETQFVVFILNASRRLFSDRFFTSSFRPEFYTSLGHQWVIDNGPEKMLEQEGSNGHDPAPVSPMKRILLRTVPELADELASVKNVFDPWARDRGEYYSLDWKPLPSASEDPAFQ